MAKTSLAISGSPSLKLRQEVIDLITTMVDNYSLAIEVGVIGDLAGVESIAIEWFVTKGLPVMQLCSFGIDEKTNTRLRNRFFTKNATTLIWIDDGTSDNGVVEACFNKNLAIIQVEIQGVEMLSRFDTNGQLKSTQRFKYKVTTAGALT